MAADVIVSVTIRVPDGISEESAKTGAEGIVRDAMRTAFP